MTSDLWIVQFERPLARGNGPFHVGTFHVGKPGSMLRPVVVQYSDAVEALFAEQYTRLTGKAWDAIAREAVYERWGNEQIRNMLAQGHALPTLPEAIQLNSATLTDGVAQLKLKSWGLA